MKPKESKRWPTAGAMGLIPDTLSGDGKKELDKIENSLKTDPAFRKYMTGIIAPVLVKEAKNVNKN